MNPVRVSTALTAALALLLCGTLARSAQNAAQAKPAVKGAVVAFDEGKSITIEVATSAGKRKMEFTIVKDKTEIKLLGDAKAVKVGMVASIWAEKTNIGKTVATKIEAGPAPKPGANAPGNSGGLPGAAAPNKPLQQAVPGRAPAKTNK